MTGFGTDIIDRSEIVTSKKWTGHRFEDLIPILVYLQKLCFFVTVESFGIFLMTFKS